MASSGFNVSSMKAKIDKDAKKASEAEWEMNIDAEYAVLVEDCPIKAINGPYDVIARSNKDSKFKFEHRFNRDITIYFLQPNKPTNKTPRNNNTNNNTNNNNGTETATDTFVDFGSFANDPLDLLYFHWVISLRGDIYYYAMQHPDENDLVGAYPPSDNWNLNYNNIGIIEKHYNSQKNNSNNNNTNDSSNNNSNENNNETTNNNENNDNNTSNLFQQNFTNIMNSNFNWANQDLSKPLKLTRIRVEASVDSKHMQYHAMDLDYNGGDKLLHNLPNDDDNNNNNNEDTTVSQQVKNKNKNLNIKSRGSDSEEDDIMGVFATETMINFRPSGHGRVLSLDSEFIRNEYEFINTNDIPNNYDENGMGNGMANGNGNGNGNANDDNKNNDEMNQNGNNSNNNNNRIETIDENGQLMNGMNGMMNGMMDGTNGGGLYGNEMPYFDAQIVSETQYGQYDTLIREEEIPVQVNEIVFELAPNQPLGFLIHTDDRKLLEISDIKQDCPAHEVGLQRGDVILAINGENIGSNVTQGIELLSEIKEKPINYFTEFDASTGKMVNRITFTICRQLYDNINIVVNRCGNDKCNGRYYYHHLDDKDCPVFIQDIEEIIEDMAIYELMQEYASIGKEYDMNRSDLASRKERKDKMDQLRQQTMSGSLDIKPCKIYRSDIDAQKHEFTWCIGCDLSFNPYKVEEYYDLTNPKSKRKKRGNNSNNNHIDDGNNSDAISPSSDNSGSSNSQKQKPLNRVENYYFALSVTMIPPASGWKVMPRYNNQQKQKFLPVPQLEVYNRSQKLMRAPRTREIREQELGYDPNDPSLTREEREWREHERQKSRYVSQDMDDMDDLANVLAGFNVDDVGDGNDDNDYQNDHSNQQNGYHGDEQNDNNGNYNNNNSNNNNGNNNNNNMDDGVTPTDDQSQNNIHFRRPSWITGFRPWAEMYTSDYQDGQTDNFITQGGFGIDLSALLASNPNFVPIDEQQPTEFHHTMQHTQEMNPTGLFGNGMIDDSGASGNNNNNNNSNNIGMNGINIYDDGYQQQQYMLQQQQQQQQMGQQQQENDMNDDDGGKRTEIRINGYLADMPSIVRDEITRFKELIKQKQATPQTNNSNGTLTSFTSASDGSGSGSANDGDAGGGATKTDTNGNEDGSGKKVEESGSDKNNKEKEKETEKANNNNIIAMEAMIETLERLGELWGTNIQQWRKKYNKMKKKYELTLEAKNTMEENAAQLYDDLQKMNQSFYELYLEHSDLKFMYEEDNETHKRIIMQHKQQIVQMTQHLWDRKQKEQELIQRINNVSSHNRNISTLSQMLDEPFETYLRDQNIQDEFADLNNETAMELEAQAQARAQANIEDMQIIENNNNNIHMNGMNGMNNMNGMLNPNMNNNNNNLGVGLGITDVTLATPPPSIANTAMNTAPATAGPNSHANSGSASVTQQSFSEMSEMMVDGAAVYDVDTNNNNSNNIEHPSSTRPISHNDKTQHQSNQSHHISAQAMSMVVENAFQNNETATNNNRRASVTFGNESASDVIRTLRMQLSDEKTQVIELQSLVSSKEQQLSEAKQDLESMEKNLSQLYQHVDNITKEYEIKSRECLEYEEQIDVLCQQLGRSRSSLPDALKGSFVQSTNVGHGKTAIRIPPSKLDDEFDFLSYNDDQEESEIIDMENKQVSNPLKDEEFRTRLRGASLGSNKFTPKTRVKFRSQPQNAATNDMSLSASGHGNSQSNFTPDSTISPMSRALGFGYSRDVSPNMITEHEMASHELSEEYQNRVIAAIKRKGNNVEDTASLFSQDSQQDDDENDNTNEKNPFKDPRFRQSLSEINTPRTKTQVQSNLFSQELEDDKMMLLNESNENTPNPGSTPTKKQPQKYQQKPNEMSLRDNNNNDNNRNNISMNDGNRNSIPNNNNIPNMKNLTSNMSVQSDQSVLIQHDMILERYTSGGSSVAPMSKIFEHSTNMSFSDLPPTAPGLMTNAAKSKLSVDFAHVLQTQDKESIMQFQLQIVNLERELESAKRANNIMNEKIEQAEKTLNQVIESKMKSIENVSKEMAKLNEFVNVALYLRPSKMTDEKYKEILTSILQRKR